MVSDQERGTMRGKIPRADPLGPRQQDYYYKHVFHRTGYPGHYVHSSIGGSAYGYAGASDSENWVATEKLQRVTSEISSTMVQYAQIDRQRAGMIFSSCFMFLCG
jgi:hypothetical protein